MGTVTGYQAQFERLLAKVGNFLKIKKLSCFIIELKESIQVDVQANVPSTLTMAIGFAHLYEAIKISQKSVTTTQPS